MSNLHYFFYELPGNPVGLDAPNKVILSGFPIDDEPNINNPFGFETTYQLDERSQALIGQETATVSFVDLVEDCVPLPPPKRKWMKKDKPKPVQFGQLYFSF